MSKIKLTNWYEIDEHRYLMYILKGYEIIVKVKGDVVVFMLNGKRHREDGPAVKWDDGSQFWYQHGNRHREDGPAIIWQDGDRWWFLNGHEYTEEEYNEEVKKYVQNKTN